jgi:hypothetical protein
MTVDKCVSCQFYDRQPIRPNDGRGIQWGQCRREAPRLQPINAKSHMIEGVWPHVRDDDWCGELKPATRRAEPRVCEAASGPLVSSFGPLTPVPSRPAMHGGLANGMANGIANGMANGMANGIANVVVTPQPSLAMGAGRAD